MKPKLPREPIGLAAVILAGGVSVAIVALSIGAAVAEASERLNFSEPAATVLSTVLGASVGALASYLGTARNPPPEPEDDGYYDDEAPTQVTPPH